MPVSKTAIIIGAGPAGLTAAYELLTRTDIKPIILERSEHIGGICRTIDYKGNKIDIGGHRFFSKSERVMQWWLNILPIDPSVKDAINISYQNRTTSVTPEGNATDDDKVMLVRKRVSHIYYLRKFFQYPVAADLNTLRKLGLIKTARILASYCNARVLPVKEQKSLEDFFINRFGKELYHTFFKDYTEKIWGIACSSISAEWGAQRIKKLSIGRTLLNAIKIKQSGIAQKDTDTSLIEQFLYPKYGPGQLWEEVAEQVVQMGGVIHKNMQVQSITHDDDTVYSIIATEQDAKSKIFKGDYFFSTMPVKELVAGLQPQAPENIQELADGLMYRDFITVGLLVKKLLLKNSEDPGKLITDTWMYIQEKNSKIGRLQIFNNWSPHLVKDKDTVWLGLEYFCKKDDDLWQMKDADLAAFAISELHDIGIIDKTDAMDHVVVRDEKTYPAYFGTYDRFNEVRDYLTGFDNLFLIGRNGMHKYNNSDTLCLPQ